MHTPVPSRLSGNTLRKICFGENNNHRKQPQFFLSSSNHEQQSLIESHIISLLNGCTDLTHLKRVHAHIYRCGLDQNCYVVTKLIRTLTKLNSPMKDYACLVFHQVRHPNPFLWTALIRGYAVNGPVRESITSYGSMRRDGNKPVSFTFSALFKACTSMGDVGLGRQVHGQVFRIGGFESDLLVGNTLIDMYVKCGMVVCARKVFDEMPERDVISGTSLIGAYAKDGEMTVARELFDELPVKDVMVWTTMITGYAQNAKPKEALELFEKMQSCRVEADEFTLVGAISACAQVGSTKYAMWIKDLAEKSGHGPVGNVVVGSALIDMYSKCGRAQEAYEIFKVMTERNVYTYSSMIVGFAVHGHFDAAMQLFYEMERMDIKPNEVTFVGVLTACSHSGMVEEGRRLFRSMEESYGVAPTADHYACMVDLLGRSGHLEEALNLAKSMSIHPHGVCGVHCLELVAFIIIPTLQSLQPAIYLNLNPVV